MTEYTAQKDAIRKFNELNLDIILSRSGRKRSELAVGICADEKVISTWCSGRAVPSPNALLRLYVRAAANVRDLAKLKRVLDFSKEELNKISATERAREDRPLLTLSDLRTPKVKSKFDDGKPEASPRYAAYKYGVFRRGYSKW